MDEVASIKVLHLAYQWLCKQRKDYPHNADVWDVRWRWEEIRPQLQERLRAGVYRLGALERIQTSEKTIEHWSAKHAHVIRG